MILANRTDERVKQGMGEGFVVLFYDKIYKMIERFSNAIAIYTEKKLCTVSQSVKSAGKVLCT